MTKHTCQVSGKLLPDNEVVLWTTVSEPVAHLIRQDYPDMKEDGYISVSVLNQYRNKYVKQLLADENGELNTLEKEVMSSIQHAELLSRNIEPEIDEQLTMGQRLADRIADFGGSWTFIIFFFSFIMVWMVLNLLVLMHKAFDPYPFILLNLILSCLAALQAPVIMMSQNRQEAKDRLRSQHDYQVNLKAELEIQQLHEKVDHLMIRQGQRLLEIQQIQTEMLQGILDKLKEAK